MSRQKVESYWHFLKCITLRIHKLSNRKKSNKLLADSLADYILFKRGHSTYVKTSYESKEVHYLFSSSLEDPTKDIYFSHFR